MVEPTVLAIGAVAFLLVLILILRNAASEEPIQKGAKKDKQKLKQLQSKQQKPKKGRSALKKNERAGITSEWQVVGDSSARDAHEMLEFLKGKDPNEIAKQQAASTKQPTKKKGKKAKEEVQSSEDSATDDGGVLEGFEEVKKKEKAPTNDKKKKKKEKKPEEIKDQSKPYFRLLNPDGTPVKDEKQQKGRKGRINSGDEAQGERKPREPRPEGEKRERKPKPEGEKREPRERKEGDEPRERKPREPRPPREPREERRPVTSPPNVTSYVEADLNELLNAITKDYKPKKKEIRFDSQFSPIPRHLILRILGKLEARDLVALSRVNHYFKGVSRNDSLWKTLCLRDFGLKEKDQTKKISWRTYKNEFSKKRNRRSKKEEAAVPQGEEKDTKGKQKPSKEEEVTPE